MGNSVIYRPAYDAEIEYLESTGMQYIDTGVIAHIGDVLSFDIVTKFSDDIVSNTWLTGWYAGKLNSVLLGMYQNNIYFTYNLDLNITSVSDGLYDKNHIIYNSPNGIIINDEVVNSSVVNTPLTADIGERSLNIFARWTTNNFDTTPPTIGYFIKAKVYQFKIILNNSLIRDFIPVRMGSVGYLYDKVSKQLFANKGTGNFILGNDVSNAIIPQQRCVLYFGNQRSVGFERIYEEYEWLQGRNGAYINTNHKLVTIEDRFEIKFNYDGNTHNPDGFEQDLFGTINQVGEGNVYVAAYLIDTLGVIYAKLQGYIQQYPISLPCTLNLSADSSNYHFSINGQLYSKSSNGLTEQEYNNVHLFKCNTIDYPRSALQYFHGDIAYFKITDTSSNVKMHLIPCKLLQSIPAILDGNGIARQAGECGMWDKVSNRFYGNVANSGTFTVKGPKCYEEYEWLVAEIPPQSELMTIGVGDVFNYSRVYESIGNSSHLMTDGYNYYTSSPAMVGIGVWNGSQNVENKAVNFTNGLDVVCTQDKLTFNSVEFPKYGFPASLRWNNYASAGGANTVVKTSSITVDGSVRYVPCKLTHGIPASMDANGIARPTGTCGMWDKVNDRFYGNVANSGTFTVSND